MGPALAFLAEQFQLLRLRVCVQLQQDCTLPAFKGSMLHGWFGHALKKADEQAYFVCYGEHANRQPKPYLISPPEDHKIQWRKGELLHFELALFGSAVNLVDKLLLALKLGEKMGFGRVHIPFQVISVSSVLPSRVCAGVETFTLAQALSHSLPAALPMADCELALHLQTPVRFKHHGRLLDRQPPELEFWLNHVLRRLKQLSQFWVCDDASLFDHLYEQRPQLGGYQLTSHCYFEDWQRYSMKVKSQLPFGGLKGQVSFYGEIGEALPLLVVGEQLNIGGKTTFGLGRYQLIQPPSLA